MSTILGLVGATLGGAAGWWLADGFGLLWANLASVIVSGLGFYYGRKLATTLVE
jgi:hypothetical protein